MVLRFGAEHKEVEVCVAKPGMITSSGTIFKAGQAFLFGFANIFAPVVRTIALSECAAALLSQVVHGFEKEPLTNADLVELGRAALRTQ
jgi:hypothetical protein